MEKKKGMEEENRKKMQHKIEKLPPNANKKRRPKKKTPKQFSKKDTRKLSG